MAGNGKTTPKRVESPGVQGGQVRQQYPVVTHQSIEAYSGPLPTSSELEAFGKIDPSFPDRIMVMAEQEGKHRHAMESSIVKGHNTSQLVRIGAAFFLALGLMFLSYLFMDRGHAVEGASLLGVTIIGLAAVFLTGKNAKQGKEESEN